MFAQQFDKFIQATFFVGAQMIMNVPAQIILAKVSGILGAALNDVIERIQAKALSFVQISTQGEIAYAATQCVVGKRSEIVGIQRFEFWMQTSLGKQDSEQLHAGKGGGIAINLANFFDGFFVCQKDAFHLTQRGNGNSIQNVVTIMK